MKKSKAQITLFIIIGLLILLLGSFIVYQVFKNRIPPPSPKNQSLFALKPIKAYFDDCIYKISEEAMQKLGESGLIYPSNYISSKDSKIAFFYYNGKGYFPKKELIEEQLAKYIIENSPSCVERFSKPGVIVEADYSNLRASVKIEQKEANFFIFFPLKIYAGGEEFTLNDFSTTLNTDFYGLYDTAYTIFQETEKNPEWIKLMDNLPYAIKIVKAFDAVLIYEISNEKGLEGKPYKYRFAMKYENL